MTKENWFFVVDRLGRFEGAFPTYKEADAFVWDLYGAFGEKCAVLERPRDTSLEKIRREVFENLKAAVNYERT